MLCPQCNTPVSDGVLFCDHCGYRLDEVVGAATGPLETGISPRASLDQKADLTVQVGPAEDAIPLLLEIRRTRSLLSPVEDLLKSREAGAALKTELRPHLDAIDAALQRVWVQRGLYELAMPSGEQVLCYVCCKSLGRLLSPSLLAQLLPVPQAPFREGQSGGKAVATATQRLAMSQRLSQGEPEALSSAGQNRYLALSVKDPRSFVAGWEGQLRSRASLRYQRDFLPEALAALPGCTFQVFKHEVVRHQPNPPVAASGLIAAVGPRLRELFAQPIPNRQFLYEVRYSVPVNSIARLLVQVAAWLAGIHGSGQVHGDLKPDNVLLGADGPVPIDGFSLKAGDISPAASPGWAAPEQLTTAAVSFATDIYPLGVMLASLIQGQITGEMINYAIPSSHGAPRVITIVRDPLIFLGPEAKRLPEAGMADWLGFIERCLLYDPARRFADGAEFGRELEALVARHPLQGQIDFDLQNRGSIQPVLFPSQALVPCRTLRDDVWGDLGE